ncbi:LysR substrate-binding domain-containing protein [Variovorax saccharolyticus]|uniref:LysR substrate-binding domain-containing protein n=1 Tax=Variovorax saccharolyticus TaxID=3053516 RepID=UPI002578DBEE|nr:LysR substrate-binding domain-containing protein [Variovorax sp. J31P216]MDM0023702.1 LysR substrate-binding domain-containing protein [Variovorax sp. J31P216]
MTNDDSSLTDEMVSSIEGSRRPRRLPPLSSLRAFEAAAAHQSFQRAARELSVTPTAISHQVRGLEDSLGQPLFRRLTRQLALTPAGERLFSAVREGLDVMEAGVRVVRARSARETVTLTTHAAFAARWVLPRMASFRAACPGVELRLHASDAVVDLTGDEADLAIRSGTGQWAGLSTEPLIAERYAPVCSPLLGLRRVRDLAKHPLIHFDWQPSANAPASWARWFDEAGIASPARRGKGSEGKDLSFSDESHAMLAALAGHGIALLSLTLAADELSSGALLQPFGPSLSTGGYFLAAAKGREREPAIQAVWRWAAAEASR